MTMALGNSRAEKAATWSVAARLFHWITALLVLVLLPFGWLMGDVRNAATRFDLFQLHKSLGLTVLALTLVRLAWRAAEGRPAHDADMARWEIAVSRLVHIALFTLLIAMPLTGWIFSSASFFQAPIPFFGLFDLPRLTGPDKAIDRIFTELHVWFGYGLAALVGLHVLGALKHAIIDRDRTLARMCFAPRDEA